MKLSILLTLILVLGGTIHSSAFDKTEEGILVTVGQTHIELVAVRPGIFRLSISSERGHKPAPSIFLGGLKPEGGAKAPKENWEAVTIGNEVGVKTSEGALLIDTTTGSWRLQNAQSADLIKDGTFSVIEKKDQSHRDVLRLTADMGTGQPLHFYGSGNGTAELLKTAGDSHMSNGIAVIPYYWCTTGYGAFGVSADDDSPASWKADPAAGSVQWTFPGRTADLYLMPAANLREAAQKYADLTGHPKVSPKWSFGYLQSRWGWQDKAYVDSTLKTFQDHKLPVDAFIFDFECYTKTPDYALKPDGEPKFPDFTWNEALFPKPAEQIAAFDQQGIHVIPIRKPRIGNSATLQMMRDKGWILVAGKNGEQTGLMDARDINFENPKVRAWYVEQLHRMIDDGVAGWWDDEGESVYTKYYYWNLAEFTALAKFKLGRRHWSIDRAFQPGMAPMGGAAWTGDIQSDWQTLASTPANLLNWGLAGMPYGACDIGGFSGSPTPEMLTRWMQAGVFFPVMRSHSVNTVQPHFPWLYGKEAEDAMRQALDLRYRLIPFYYSLAHETYATGVPFMRPLVMEFPDDPKVANMGDQWLMGRGLMAAPILAAGGKRTIYFPQDTWYKFDTGEVQPGGQSIDVTAPLDGIPVYVRAGTILTLSPVVQNTAQLPGGPLDVQVYAGADADFTLVEDDGLTYAYVNGQVRTTKFHWDEASRTLSWKQDGTYRGKDIFTAVHVTVFDSKGKLEATSDLSATGSTTFK